MATVDNSPISNTTIVGRFSSQLLAQRGASRDLKLIDGRMSNVFSNSKGGEYYPSVDSVTSSSSFSLFTGSVDSNTFWAVKAYFSGRGMSETQANTMTLLVIDVSKVLKISPVALIEQTGVGKISFSSETYRIFNNLRPPNSQTGTMSNVNNRNSALANKVMA